MKKTRPSVLSTDDTRQLLNGYGLYEGTPLGDLWVRRCEELRDLEKVVSDYLRQATAPSLVAKGMSRDVRKKGLGRLVLQTQTDGRLHLSFQRGPSVVPSMAELRKLAKTRGVDISGLGIRRREIFALLEGQGSKDQIQPDEVTRAPLVDTVLEQLRGKFPMDGV